MANILLEPIDVDGTDKCLVCESNLATVAIQTDINSTGNTNEAITSDGCYVDSDSWLLLPASALEGDWGELSFGVTCLDTVTIRIHGYDRGAISSTSYEVYLDGVSEDSGTVPADADGVEIEITLPAHTPCGSVITVEVEVDTDDSIGNLDPISLEIVGTT